MRRCRPCPAPRALSVGLAAVALASGLSAPRDAVAQPPVTEPERPTTGLLPDKEPVVGTTVAASREGALGLDTVLSAVPGATRQARARLSLLYGTADDFPVQGARNTFSGNTLALAYSPHELVELYAALKGTTNQNASTYPRLLQTQGDTVFGVKSGAWVMPNVALGGAVSGHFASGLGAGAAAFNATSVWLRALATADWSRTGEAPVRLLLDVGYYFENSDAATANAPQALDKVQEWGLQVARYDRVTVGLGLEAPVADWISPFVEYRIDVPLNVELSRRADLKDDFTFGAVPHALTPGVRFFPLRGLALDAAVRLGLSSDTYLGVPATPPWVLMTGVSYAFEPAGPAPVAPPPVAPPKPTGTITGRVVLADSGAGDAVVEYPGANKTHQLASRDGRFESYELPAGKAKVRVRAPRHVPKEVEVDVIAGKSATVEVRLERDPAQAVGTLSVQLAGPGGAAAGALVIPANEAAGQAEVRAEVTAGEAWKGELKPGTYKVTATAPGLRARTLEVEVVAGQPATLRIALEKGGASRAQLVGKRIGLTSVVQFNDGKATLSASSEPLLDDIAEVMRGNPQLLKVLVGGHTDGRGDEAMNQRLSADRARAVVDALVARGIDRGRLASRGYGSKKPIVPNATRVGQEKNRRVEFIVLEQSR